MGKFVDIASWLLFPQRRCPDNTQFPFHADHYTSLGWDFNASLGVTLFLREDEVQADQLMRQDD
jgi:hypothetical protein